MHVDVEFQERYWYPDDGGQVWIAGYTPVDPESGRYLGREAPELTALGLRIAGVAGAARHHGEALAAEAAAPGRPLELRRDRPELFTRYAPLPVFGEQADSAIAADRGGALVVATRLPVSLEQAGGWGDTVVLTQGRRWRDVLTGRTHRGGDLRLAELLDTYPVALLVPADDQD